MKNLVLSFALVLMSVCSFANNGNNDTSNNNVESSLVSEVPTFNISSVAYTISEKYDGVCKWFVRTTVKTTSIFFLGIHVGTSVETTTDVICR